MVLEKVDAWNDSVPRDYKIPELDIKEVLLKWRLLERK
jgi:hypothetical protein